MKMRNYKEELDIVNEESKNFKPKKWWAIFYFIATLYFMVIFLDGTTTYANRLVLNDR